MGEHLIEAMGIKKYFKTGGGMLHAIDGVDFTIARGKTLGVVGESGCGKSTLGRVMLRLTSPTAGQMRFDGRDIFSLGAREMKRARVDMQMIFQDPYASINPRMTVSEIIAEPIRIMGGRMNKKDLEKRVYSMMNMAGLSARLVNAYPHELDGGRRQRVGIARALSVGPKFIVCDEPVSALDVSIQAQILNLLMDLQEEMGLTYLFITHDLSVVKHISDDIMVMYLGKCVEKTATKELFQNPLHPYTKALLAAMPVPDIDHKIGEVIRGEVTSPIAPKPGCRFAMRCPHMTEACVGQELSLAEASPGHLVECVLWGSGGQEVMS